ncbi:MAG: ribonuclease G [Pseudomonadales bacterium]|jgi:ribonuclease G|nr:ribonuclease G [Pseudomonadales bacterium]
MSVEILINHSPSETRVALTEQGLLQEIYIERNNKRGPVGNIYMGKVIRVMPGMQAAFVDIGLDKAGFIHAADIAQLDETGFEVPLSQALPISQLLYEGQYLVVQVAKEPISSKGARLTTHLSLASRYLVYMPRTRHLGISQRIENEEERTRLLDTLERSVQQEGLSNQSGFILRTAAEGVNENELRSDIQFLRRVWSAVHRRIQEPKSLRVIYEDLVLYMRAMRDLLKPQVEKIRIDDRAIYEEVLAFARDFIPEIEPHVEQYQNERPLFDLYGIDDEIQKALSRTVRLKSGGNLVIDQNEAMTTIDVNTGAFLGTRTQEETIFKTNLEAAKAIARQLKVRNIGGIIVVDFIDMQDEEHQRQVLRTFTKALERDPARTRVSALSELGLVEMTRKRTRESLRQILCKECPTCDGRSSIKTPETVCYDIFREIMRVARAFENSRLLVMGSQEVVDRMLEEESDTLVNLEQLTGKSISFQVEALYTTEQFDVVMY